MTGSVRVDSRKYGQETRQQGRGKTPSGHPGLMSALGEEAGTPNPLPEDKPRVGSGTLTLLEYEHPAYLLNPNFELEWWNAAAERAFLDGAIRIVNEISGRSIFGTFFAGSRMRHSSGRAEVLRFHLAIAKRRLTKSSLLTSAAMGGSAAQEVGALFDEVEAENSNRVISTEVNLGTEESPQWHHLTAAFFREGTLFTYLPAQNSADALTSLLSRRHMVIRDILSTRRPFVTPLAVLVADLEGSIKICGELPPEEYFDLINTIWERMGDRLRNYYATHGKHAGDGLVYYFLPQPDCNHLYMAVKCAHEMRQRMKEINRDWKRRKHWLNDLRLNIGLDEGVEWFGTYQTPTHVEFTVLGDTINRASRLSDFARGGTVWISKRMMSRIPEADRKKIQFGIRYPAENGSEILVPQTYARIANLIDVRREASEKLIDIAGMAVTEVMEVQSEGC